ncbi:MAG: hypothetical protein KC897_00765 [Candidatus Omnitrophica bacterium]|nr:hypothetical protein [Candidatus Omnitrophota bacterium]MCB9720265.1 hypothetical protein [Candidatus Omnitrophota bacterium]
MKRVVYLSILLILFTPIQAIADTLGDVLERQDMSGYLADIPAAQPVTSYAAYQDRTTFLLAYYHAYPKDPDFLEDTLRILYIDLPARQVTRKEILLPVKLSAYEPTYLGSVLEVRKIGPRFYLKGHLNPSASPTLVLTEELDVWDVLPGWVTEVDEGEGITCRHNAVHFGGVVTPPEFFRYDPVNRTSVALKN